MDKTTIRIEGNKGYNWVKMVQIDDNKIYLEVADCGVIITSVIITAEALSDFFNSLLIKENKDFLKVVRKHQMWDYEYSKEVMKGCRYANINEFI